MNVVLNEHLFARTSACIATVNVCFPTDMSGSVCLPDFLNLELGDNCPAQCAQNLFNQSTSGENFNDMKSFSIDFVEALAEDNQCSEDSAVV